MVGFQQADSSLVIGAKDIGSEVRSCVCALIDTVSARYHLIDTHALVDSQRTRGLLTWCERFDFWNAILLSELAVVAGFLFDFSSTLSQRV